MTPPRPTALYLRVSTAAQVGDERFGLAVQTRIAQQYAMAHNLRITETFQDVITGTRATRQALDELLDRAGEYEVALVSAVDRLARRTAVSYAVLDELLETGIEVHSADMGRVDPDDEMSSLNFGVRSVFAQAEHQRLAKRLRGGMIAKVLSGKPVVPLTCYGWTRGEVCEEEKQWLIQVHRWAQEGWAAATIKQELNRLGVPGKNGGKWSDSTVKYLLRNPIYKGLYSFGKARPSRGDGRDLVTCEVPALLDPEFWNATQRALDSRMKGGRPRTARTPEEFPMIGRLRCGVCGSTMSAVRNDPHPARPKQISPYRYYHCYRLYKRSGLEGDLCTHRRNYGAKKLYPFILEQLRALLTDEQALTATLNVEPVKPLNTAAAVAAIDKRLGNLKMLALDGVIPPQEYKETRAELEAQRRALTTIPLAPVRTPQSVAQARAALAQALESDNLTEIARRLDLRVTLHPDGRVDLKLNAL
ncbi:Site-specific DNA recombinase [Deinococcus reticulitermitis]|uniref:Site-specific DNA recombinase n=1 Tax=Deinococcus reticulitermitis TaxID=856736 RepID=A0A1H6SXJ4_9DEIO|nr:recombinase family protein [Deinococcus reticulitermitis]SEI68720.1 Site-specific DNA recombinase [Deinococcus reticulitermitis]